MKKILTFSFFVILTIIAGYLLGRINQHYFTWLIKHPSNEVFMLERLPVYFLLGSTFLAWAVSLGFLLKKKSAFAYSAFTITTIAIALSAYRVMPIIDTGTQTYEHWIYALFTFFILYFICLVVLAMELLPIIILLDLGLNYRASKKHLAKKHKTTV